MKQKISFGSKVADKITGFTGTVTGYSRYMTGCDQYLVIPKCEEGKTNSYPTGTWFDESRLEVIEEKSEMLQSDTGDGACGIAPIK